MAKNASGNVVHQFMNVPAPHPQQGSNTAPVDFQRRAALAQQQQQQQQVASLPSSSSSPQHQPQPRQIHHQIHPPPSSQMQQTTNAAGHQPSSQIPPQAQPPPQAHNMQALHRRHEPPRVQPSTTVLMSQQTHNQIPQPPRTSRVRQVRDSAALRNYVDGPSSKQEVKDDRFSPLAFEKVNPDAKPALTLVYTTSGSLPNLAKHVGQLVEIRIQARHLTVKNREVASGQLWGSDVYTHDSDIVAILMHTGNILARSYPPNCAGLVAFFKVLPACQDYQSSNRNGISSKHWHGKPDRFSLKVSHVNVIKEDKGYFDAELNGIKVMKQIRRANAKYGAATKLNTARRRSSFLVMFNSMNEPVTKYDLSLFTDLGQGPAFWTSTQLKNEVIYMENEKFRFEVSLEPDAQNKKFRTYRFIQMEFPPYDSTYENVPLPDESTLIKFRQRELDWNEMEWTTSGVKVRGKAYSVNKIWFVERTTR